MKTTKMQEAVSAMKAKKQFTEQVEAINTAFANWFNSKPELVAKFNEMSAEQQAEFRKRMIIVFASELANF